MLAKPLKGLTVSDMSVCMGRYTHSNQGPITKEDNRVPSWVKVPSWRACTKPMGAVAKKYIQEEDPDCRCLHTCVCAIIDRVITQEGLGLYIDTLSNGFLL